MTNPYNFNHLITDPLGNTTVYEYDLRGNRTYEGGATYPVRYAYDIFNNRISMTTFRSGGPQFIAADGDVTTWLYDEPSGLVTNKLYADGKGPSYAYTPNGNLAARTWARGVVTTYAYDGWNSLTNTVYSDGTPAVSVLYDALGRQTEVRDAAGVTAYAYDGYGSLTNETVTGVAGTNAVTRHWDTYGRSLGYSLNGIRQTTLAYDPVTGRLASMLAAGNANPFAWSYLPGADLKSQLTYPNGLTATWAYDANSRLTQVRNATQDGAISQYGYTCDAVGRRVSRAKSGTAMSESRSDAYGYNARSELISSRRAAENAEEYAYAYDPIGNRLTSADLGVSRTYTANNLNQYTGISMGGNAFVPQFDDDGNQTLIRTKTGIWSVTYNGENRPILWECGNTNITMSFDRMGRRVSYTETVGSVTNVHQTFVYDNYLQIADNAGSRYIWDPTEPIATRPLAWLHGGGAYYYTHDGNKNVSEVVDGNGAVTAHYEYAPFGDVTVAAGSLASANRFRFSSEYADDTLGLVYYNYRHYEPVTGRWTSRDPIEDSKCLCRYLYCRNNSMSLSDQLGLRCTIYIMIGHFPGLDDENELNKEGSIWKVLEKYLEDGKGECDGAFSLSCHMVSFLKGLKDKYGNIMIPDNWPPNKFKEDQKCQVPWFVNFIKSGDYDKAIDELVEKIKTSNCCCKKINVKTYCDKDAVEDFKIYTRPGVGSLSEDKNPCKNGGISYVVEVPEVEK